MEARSLWYPLNLGFLAYLKPLFCKNLSESVLLAEFLKPPQTISCWKQALSNSFLENVSWISCFFKFLN